MSPRRPLGLPITLAIVMIALLVVLTVGWVLLAVSKAISDKGYAGLYWTLLTVGTTFIALLVVGVVLYLVLSVKAINLSRRQSNFIHNVTHELKSPIASMKLYLQTLNLRQVSQEEQADFYRYMLDDVHRLDRLINQVLDAGRLETGRRNGDLEDVPLAGLLRECAATVCLCYRIPSQIVRLDLQPCVVRARRIDLEMIFRNLLDNAVKYAASEPEVEVTLRPRATGGTITRIGDNGPGIPRKLRRKIFGRFVRLGMELRREKPGTGLGLYIVRTLVKRLGGRVRVHDRGAGPGTVFEIQLPGGPLPSEQPEVDSQADPVREQCDV